MRYRMKRFWRWLRGRCQMCGLHPRTVPHAQDLYSLGPFCRSCNKTAMNGQIYGIGKRKLQELLFQ